MNRHSRMRILAAGLLTIATLSLGACSLTTNGAEDFDTVRTDTPRIGEHAWRYVLNRVFDFTDIFQFGLGLNVSAGAPMQTERAADGTRDVDYGQVGDRTFGGRGAMIAEPLGGPLCQIGKYIGAFVQCSDYCRIGRVWFAGQIAEWDGRGFYAGPERRTRTGVFVWEMIQLEQMYDVGRENYFKKGSGLWASRMSSPAMTWRTIPAKELHYEFWAPTHRLGIPPMHRGWQHWANVEAEVDAFLFYARAGVDLTEPIDFVLGLVGLDYKHDDMNLAEYRERRDLGKPARYRTEPKPASQPAY